MENNSIDCLMFDPPFLATKGPSLSEDDDNNKINKRFGVYPTERELFQFYTDSLVEFHRVLKDGGVLVYSTCTIFKDENEYQIERFLERHNEFEKEFEKLYLAHETGGSGFYICRMVKNSARV